MPVLIEEMVAEINTGPTPPDDRPTLDEQVPVAASEQELLELMSLIQQRRDRLSID